MSRWLKNVGNFLDKLDDRAEQVVEEQRSGHFLVTGERDELESNNVVASILAARGLVVQEDEEEDHPNETPPTPILEEHGVVAECGGGLSKPVDRTSHQDSMDTFEESPLNDNNPPAGKGDGWGDVSFSTTEATQDHDVLLEIKSGEANISEESHHDREPLKTTSLQRDPLPSGSESAGNESSKPANESHDDTANSVYTSQADTVEVPQDSLPPSPLSLPSTVGPVRSQSMASVSSVDHAPSASSLLGGLAAAPPVLSFSTSAAKVAATAFKSFRSESHPRQSTGGPEEESQSSTTVDHAKHPSHQALLETQKEVRTLRRHVVALNQQLEAAEAEMKAQRAELDRAAERLQKDSVRHKQDRETDKARHAQELKALQAQQEAALVDQKSRYDAQVEDLRLQLMTVEERRMQEGGDWNKELADALKREQEFAIKLASVEDEKATLLSQISTLQAQQEALGGRLESLSETAENAFAREREAEDRLDEALSVHARQISQRQAREAELERTIAELGEALVTERNSRGISSSRDPTIGLNTQNHGPDAKAAALEAEIEALRGQLAHEQQRNNTLQAELREIERERTEEALISQRRQQQHDRQVEELTHSLSRIKLELRDVKRDSLRDVRPRAGEGNEDSRRIRDLSEEVLLLREKQSTSQSEIAALKSRLQGALDRAQKAESSLNEREENGACYGSDDMEHGKGIRHRGPFRKRVRDTKPTMRAALKLDAVHHGGRGTEKIGKTLDALDAFLTESGKFLRYNPLARLLFILYLLVIHLWTIALLIFHAHGFESIHGDFGGGGGLPLGPGVMMPQLLISDSQAVGKNAST